MTDNAGSHAAQTDQDRFPVEIDGRLFPSRLRPSSASRIPTPDAERNARLTASLWEQLPLPQQTQPLTDCLQVVRLYEASLRLLETWETEVKEFLRAICAANLEVLFPEELQQLAAQQRQQERRVEDMLAKIEYAGLPVGSVLTAELVAQPAERVQRQLTAALRDITDQFVVDFFAALDRMVDRQLIGLIQWHGAEICKFHFFRQTVNYAETSRELYRTGEATEVLSDRDVISVEWTPTTRSLETSGIARHEHHLMQAKIHPVHTSDLIIPWRVQKLLTHIPSWLAEYLKIVDGQRIRERMIARDFQEQVVQQADAVIKIPDREILHPIQEREVLEDDPAVTLDFYVLTGWGTADIEAEQARRKKIAQQQNFEQEFSRQQAQADEDLSVGTVLMVILLPLSFVLAVWGLLANGFWLLVGIGAGMGALLPLQMILEAVLFRAGKQPHWTFSLATSAAFIAGWSGGLFLFGGAFFWSWQAIGLGLALCGVGYLLTLLAQAFYGDLTQRPASP